MTSFFSFRSRTSAPSTLPPSQPHSLDSQGSQEPDEKIIYQATDRNPARAKEPLFDNKTDEMNDRGQKPSPSTAAKILSQGLRTEAGGANEQPTVEGFYAQKEKLEETQKKLGNAESRMSKLQAENKKLHDRIAEMDCNTTFQKIPGPRHGTVEASKELDSSNRRKDQRIKELETQLVQTRRLLEVKTAELSEAQAFSIKPDDLPGSDIIGMVKLLNSEIFNTAKAISGQFEKTSTRKADYDETLDKWEFFNGCRDTAEEYIGEKLYAYNCQIDDSMTLRQPIAPKDCTPLELALHCVLVGWCSYVAGIIGPVPGDGEALQRCYENIRVREEQSVSARWRVMVAGATKDIKCSSIGIAVTRVMAVLCICGLSSEEPWYGDVEKSLWGRLQHMENLLRNLKNSMHVGIVSGDMELISVGFGEVYDPHFMTDEYKEEKVRGPVTQSSSMGRVLCTVGLGLRKTVVKKGEGARYELLKPPEVALVDVLENFTTPNDLEYDA